MNTTLSALSDIWIMPLNAAHLKQGADELHLLFLEAESSYSLNEITRPTMNGASRLIGHSLSATLYVPQNDITATKAALDALSGNVLDEVIFDLGKPNASVTNYINQYNGKCSLVIANSCEMTWRMESSELRPRYILSLSGFISPTSFTIIP